MTAQFDRELEERLVRCPAIYAQSDEASPDAPSTARLTLLRMLADELTEMGPSG